MQPIDFRNKLRLRLNGVIAMTCEGSRRSLHQVARTLRSIARAAEDQQAAEEPEAARVAGMKEKAANA